MDIDWNKVEFTNFIFVLSKILSGNEWKIDSTVEPRYKEIGYNKTLL